ARAGRNVGSIMTVSAETKHTIAHGENGAPREAAPEKSSARKALTIAEATKERDSAHSAHQAAIKSLADISKLRETAQEKVVTTPQALATGHNAVSSAQEPGAT